MKLLEVNAAEFPFCEARGGRERPFVTSIVPCFFLPCRGSCRDRHKESAFQDLRRGTQSRDEKLRNGSQGALFLTTPPAEVGNSKSLPRIDQPKAKPTRIRLLARCPGG